VQRKLEETPFSLSAKSVFTSQRQNARSIIAGMRDVPLGVVR